MPITLGITIGDPGGIGPEVALKALPHVDPDVDVRLLGPGALWAFHARLLEQANPAAFAPIAAALTRVTIMETPDPLPRVHPQLGQTNARNGSVAARAVMQAVNLWQEGCLDGFVTAPLSKEGLKASGIKHPGHTELLQELTHSPHVGMLLVGGGLRVALATIHVPLKLVPEILTADLVVDQARLLSDFLTTWLRRPPRLGICGVNPHAGEGGMFGDEEQRILEPALARLRSAGVLVAGPLPGDTAFHEALQGHHDAILAMYHDQGLAPLKTVGFDEGVNITMGLPLVRTSPDHGTAFGIAGRGMAREGSMVAAIRAACSIIEARRQAHV